MADSPLIRCVVRTLVTCPSRERATPGAPPELGRAAANLTPERATGGRHGGVPELAGEVIERGFAFLEPPQRTFHAKPSEEAPW